MADTANTWTADPYWLGVATTFAFMQADLDTEANAKAGGSPVLSARLPYLERPEPEDLVGFGKAVGELNEEASILYWRLVRTGSFVGEHHIEFVGTEGYLGWLPPEGDDDEGWKS